MTDKPLQPEQKKITGLQSQAGEAAKDSIGKNGGQLENPSAEGEFEKDRQEIRENLLSIVSDEEPLTAGEIREKFTEENLAQMSLEEYVALLRRVPPRFITHVVRQGIRDHSSHHYAGVGDYHDGFKGVSKDGALHSTLDQVLRENPTPESVKKVLDNVLHIGTEASSREEAEQMIYDFLTSSPLNTVTSSEFADKNAIHVAMDHVADSYYGAESGNEIFIVFPTAFAVSEYDIGSQGMPFHKGLKLDLESQTHQLNDFWLNRKSDGRGVLKIDAGIVFIAEDARVDPQTGSKYALDKDNKPIRNEDQIMALQQLAMSLTEKGILNQTEQKLTDYMKLRSKVLRQKTKIQEMKEKGESFYIGEKEAELEKSKMEFEQAQKDIQTFIDEARAGGITDPRFFQILDASNKDSWPLDNFIKLYVDASRPGAFDQKNWDARETLDSRLRGMGLQFKLAENPVSSQQYWEDYFQKIGKRPSKVVYYKGSPNEALKNFQKENGLNENPGHVDLKEAFEDDSLHDQERIQNKLEPQLEEFQKIANGLLDNYFPEEDRS